jgi:hypothetical protein
MFNKELTNGFSCGKKKIKVDVYYLHLHPRISEYLGLLNFGNFNSNGLLIPICHYVNDFFFYQNGCDRI